MVNADNRFVIIENLKYVFSFLNAENSFHTCKMRVEVHKLYLIEETNLQICFDHTDFLKTLRMLDW